MCLLVLNALRVLHLKAVGIAVFILWLAIWVVPGILTGLVQVNLDFESWVRCGGFEGLRESPEVVSCYESSGYLLTVLSYVLVIFA